MPFGHPQIVFITNGGGTTAYPETELYFYIVGQDVDSGKLDSGKAQRFKGEFYKAGADTDRKYCFTIIDISSDNRLSNALHTTQDGQRLFENIVRKMPALVVSNSNLTDLSNVNSVDVFSLEEIDYSAVKIHKRIGNTSPINRRKIYDFLNSANEILILQPSLAGIGANLNKIIDLILRKGI